MMMRMIVAAGIPALTDGSRPPDEDNPHGYFEYEPVKRTRQDSSWLLQAGGRAVKMVHLLLMDLPTWGRYAVVMMHRDLDEVLASQRQMLRRLGRPGSSLPPEALKRVYASQMSQVVSWMDRCPCFRRLDVDYGTVIREPRREAERLAAFLGRGDPDAMAAAVDPALYRNRSRPTERRQ